MKLLVLVNAVKSTSLEQWCGNRSAAVSASSLTGCTTLNGSQILKVLPFPSSSKRLLRCISATSTTHSLVLWNINSSAIRTWNCRNLGDERKDSSPCDKQWITLTAKNNTHIQRQQISLLLLLSEAKKSVANSYSQGNKTTLFLLLESHACNQKSHEFHFPLAQ